MNILIAVPCMDQLPAQFAQSLAMLDKGGNPCAVAFQVSSLVYTSRNELGQKAIQMGADYVMWFDSDMVFRPDTLVKLLENMKDGRIMTGMYFKRVAPYSPVLYEKLEVEDGHCVFEDLKEIPKEDLFEVKGCGFGCVLMPGDALMSVMAKYGDLFTPAWGMGEDLAFCYRARQCGYEIICDQTIPLGHVGNHIVTRGLYNAFRDQGGNT